MNFPLSIFLLCWDNYTTTTY